MRWPVGVCAHQGFLVRPTGHRQVGRAIFVLHEGDGDGHRSSPCQESGFSTRHANDAMMAMGSEAIFAWVFGVAAS